MDRLLPKNHPFIERLTRTLVLTHWENSQAATNYVSNVSKVLFYVHQWLVDNNRPPSHWSYLVSTDVEVYADYLKR